MRSFSLMLITLAAFLGAAKAFEVDWKRPVGGPACSEVKAIVDFSNGLIRDGMPTSIVQAIHIVKVFNAEVEGRHCKFYESILVRNPKRIGAYKLVGGKMIVIFSVEIDDHTMYLGVNTDVPYT